jgi:hypothetical protein
VTDDFFLFFFLYSKAPPPSKKMYSTVKRSAGTLAHESIAFEQCVSNFSVTYGAATPEDVDRDVSAALPRVKRLRQLLETAEAAMEEWPRTRAPDGTFVCEKCKEVRSSSVLMYPQKKGWADHYCKRWPCWCDRCVADALPEKCPGEGCGAPVVWTGGASFFVNVKVHEKINKREEKVVASFGLFLDPAVATLKDVKRAVLDKAGVPMKDQHYKLVGMDKTLTELGVGKGGQIIVTYNHK